MERFNRIVNFIRDLYHAQEFIPLHAPVFYGNEQKYLEECIDSTFVSSVGKFVDQFEEKIAEYTGSPKAVVCVNGTNALHLALMLCDVTAGTEVITQPLTFIATANAISYCGAVPVFLDVNRDTMGLSPDALEDFLEKETIRQDDGTGMPTLFNKTTKRRISAVVPMHTFGHPARIGRIAEICDRYGIPLVEDAAESLGSYYKEKHTGTFGRIGILSFNGNKILTTGGGGMLLFREKELAAKAKHLTTQAKVPHPWEFVHDEVGYNYRMPNLNAALGLAQLEQLPGFLASKRRIAEEYTRFFAGSDIEFIQEPENARSNYWLNCILLRDRADRDAFLNHTNKNGVMTRPAWRLMNELPMFNTCQSDELKNSKELADRLVNLPSSVLPDKQF
jgi:perosamine synthetase